MQVEEADMRVDSFDRWLHSLASRGEVRAGAFFTAAIVAGMVAVPQPAAAHDVQCPELWNPHGQTTPPAGHTTLPGAQGGENEDGFFQVVSCSFDETLVCPSAENPVFAEPCFCEAPAVEEAVILSDGCDGTGHTYDYDPTLAGIQAFPFGTVVKFIEANGRTPGQQTMAGVGVGGSGADAVEWQLWGQGDLLVCSAVVPSECTCCHVPPPPK
jgi:hypothetical protein